MSTKPKESLFFARHTCRDVYSGAAVLGLGAGKPKTIACAPFSLTDLIPCRNDNILLKAKLRHRHTLWATRKAWPAAPPMVSLT